MYSSAKAKKAAAAAAEKVGEDGAEVLVEGAGELPEGIVVEPGATEVPQIGVDEDDISSESDIDSEDEDGEKSKQDKDEKVREREDSISTLISVILQSWTEPMI